MKLQYLKISNYKLFKEIEFDFQRDDFFTVIIGKNGSGKTTLIECLTIIFSSLLNADNIEEIKKISFPFNFSVRYLIRREKSIETNVWGNFYTNYIGVEINYENEIKVKLFEGENEFETFEEIENYLRKNGESIKYIMPENLIVYYSGISNIIYKLFKEYQKENILGSLDGEVKINQPFYFFIPNDFAAILISLLSYQYGEIPAMLERKFKISGFEKIEIKFKRPKWAVPKTKSVDYWGAKGDLKNFLDVLKVSSADVYYDEDKISFIFKNIESLEKVWSNYGTEKTFFEYLVALRANDLIDSISVDVIKDNLITNYNRLSEGEKQLLIIHGLKEILASENSLILLDEPDTYLHPEWKRDFIDEFFKEDESYKNFYIITSHSPNIVSAVKKGQLKILKVNNNQSYLRQYTFNPYGKPVDDILIDFFGVGGLRNIAVEEKLKYLWKLIKENKYDSDIFKMKFSELENEIGKDDEDLIAIKIEINKRKKINEKDK